MIVSTNDISPLFRGSSVLVFYRYLLNGYTSKKKADVLITQALQLSVKI